MRGDSAVMRALGADGRSSAWVSEAMNFQAYRLIYRFARRNLEGRAPNGAAHRMVLRPNAAKGLARFPSWMPHRRLDAALEKNNFNIINNM